MILPMLLAIKPRHQQLEQLPPQAEIQASPVKLMERIYQEREQMNLEMPLTQPSRAL